MMKITTTILLAGCLLPKIKDTISPIFNKYAMSADLKVPADYYSIKTGFFCNTERALQKRTKIQVKVRLGSLEHTQKLEGYNLSTLPSYLLSSQ